MTHRVWAFLKLILKWVLDLKFLNLSPTFNSSNELLMSPFFIKVDFAAPLGYVEPTPVPRAPPATMASKLNIDTSGTQSVDARGSAAKAPGAPTSGGAATWEAFKGGGRTMGGKMVKGKGVQKKKIEPVDSSSKIYRTDVQRTVTADTQIGDRQVPARLALPFGTVSHRTLFLRNDARSSYSFSFLFW